MTSQIDILKKLINDNPDFVILTGAGVSTASGIPDFRSKDGLYNKVKNAEYYLSIDALANEPQAFFKFYKKYILLDNIKPNVIHNKLAYLEKQNKLGCIITQNIDGLHILAGNQKVIELHGTIYENYCMKCHKTYSLEYVKQAKDIPYCQCGGKVRPNVVLYGESLFNGIIEKCYQKLNKTNLLIVAGTGLSVSTAANIFNMFNGKYIVILNNEPTPYDHRANLIIRDDLAQVFDKI
ncbi:MAG: NAD-dependent protein deacylase [Mycoplasmataceae bacterium]|jgi:NAD-dependent deacetylase|nr:NAD-dependent protein deacylase [Mycoplasmataceae bacterium]